MAIWFVTRHAGALDWAKEKGLFGEDLDIRSVSEIDTRLIALGDIVIGTLPVHLVADISARGARYMHISMQVPASRRGMELSSSEMAEHGATCREFLVFSASDELSVAADRLTVPAAGEGVHVCIVSDQYMANLLPILKRKPSHVELVCTPEVTRPEGGQQKLLDALKYFGYGGEQITSHVIGNDSSTVFPVARQAARELRERMIENYPTQPLTLNATGGTKTLSTAFFLEFQGIEIIYTDSQHGSNCIRFMSDQARDPEPLGTQISRIESYLNCQGYKIKNLARVQEELPALIASRSDMTQRLAEYKGYTLSKLNEAAQKFQKEILGTKLGKFLPENERAAQLNSKLPNLQISSLKERDEKLCDQLSEAKLLQKTSNGGYAFASAEAMQYLTGGWIEEWAWSIARSCEPDDCMANVTVSYLAGAPGDTKIPDNELDLVVLHNNRLLIAECKTIQWNGTSAKQEIFNKLDALGTHARGLFGKSILISAYPPDDKAKRRAKAYGIEIIHSSSLHDLKNEILRWMGKPLETTIS